MVFLKRSSLVFIICLTGCISSTYRISNADGGRFELAVTPDRIALECEDVSENRDVPYGFMIHVLDDAKTVIEVQQMNTLGKDDCDNRLVKIGRILRTGRNIYVAGVGDLDTPRKIEKWTHTFPAHGTFNSNGRVLQFMAIANENGLCFDAQMGDEKPCPDGVDFPIHDKR